jgi:anaerobic dimethyl sulfoxide reductase subunit A
MLIAMAYIIITENLQDQAFLDKYTVGFDRFTNYVLGREDGIAKTPEWAQAITGVPSTTTTILAREYATIKPAALMDGLAPGRTAYGEQFHRAAITLAAMTGNIGIPGGNAPGIGGLISPLSLGPLVSSRMAGEENPLDLEAPPRKDSILYQRMVSLGGVSGAKFYSSSESSARVPRIRLADAILKGRRGGYPADYKLLYLVNSNYVNQYANSNKIAQALKTLEFIVVHEQVLSPTARFADIVLPTNTFLERNDVTTGGVGPYYGFMNKAVDSLDESKSHFEICIELATRLGISDYSDKTEEEWLREVVGGCKDIPDYEEFKKAGIHKVKFPKPFIAFEKQISNPEKHPFATPSGKIEIFSQTLADMNNPEIPPIPKHIEFWERPNDPLSKKYPLQLITPHPRRRAHTQFENIPWLTELYPQVISISAVDARVRGISSGDMVKVFNDRGQMIITVSVTERIMPGVVSLPQGAWYNPDESGVDRGGCANTLTNDIVSPGGAFCSSTALVQVEKA